MRFLISVLLAIALNWVAVAANAEYVEGWDTDPPANNGWCYYVEGGGPQGEGDEPLDWFATGGETGGYVRTPLAELTQWTSIPGTTNYWPLYTYGDEHAIDLNANPWVRISLKDSSMTMPVDDLLGGGDLYFWVGEWIDEDGPGGADADLSFFYLDRPLTAGGAWTPNVLDIRSGDWVTLIDTQGKTAADLLDSPQQWGIGIFGGTTQPSGTLSFDNLQIVPIPEPGTWCLLVGCLLLVSRRRKG